MFVVLFSFAQFGAAIQIIFLLFKEHKKVHCRKMRLVSRQLRSSANKKKASRGVNNDTPERKPQGHLSRTDSLQKGAVRLLLVDGTLGTKNLVTISLHNLDLGRASRCRIPRKLWLNHVREKLEK